MPTDLSHDQRDLVRVRDQAGTGLPFSRGIMATSILATGLETSCAYDIAAEVQRELLALPDREIDTERLTVLTERVIARRAGSAHAQRYRAWRLARHGGRPMIICLAGAPGIGKSTIATRLALRLGINRVVPTDAIREVLRTVIPDTVLPELHVSTFESLDGDGGREGATAVFTRQARAVSAAAAAVASRLAAESRHVILEGVHLLPGDVGARLAETNATGPRPIIVELLLTLADAELHLGQLERRVCSEPSRNGRRHLEHFAVIRHLQEQLQRRARELGVPEHDIGHPDELTPYVVDRVAGEIMGGVPPKASRA